MVSGWTLYPSVNETLVIIKSLQLILLSLTKNRNYILLSLGHFPVIIYRPVRDLSVINHYGRIYYYLRDESTGWSRDKMLSLELPFVLPHPPGLIMLHWTELIILTPIEKDLDVDQYLSNIYYIMLAHRYTNFHIILYLLLYEYVVWMVHIISPFCDARTLISLSNIWAKALKTR